MVKLLPLPDKSLYADHGERAQISDRG